MLSVDDYVQSFKSELQKGKTLDELLEQIGQRMVIRDRQIRTEKQALLIQEEIIKLLEDKCTKTTT